MQCLAMFYSWCSRTWQGINYRQQQYIIDNNSNITVNHFRLLKLASGQYLFQAIVVTSSGELEIYKLMGKLDVSIGRSTRANMIKVEAN